MMTAKRRSRKIQKALRRNTDVNPHPRQLRKSAEERSREDHPAGKGRVQETQPLKGLIVGLDVASLHPEVFLYDQAEQRLVEYSKADAELVHAWFDRFGAGGEETGSEEGSADIDINTSYGKTVFNAEQQGILEGRERFRQAILHVPRLGGKNSVIDAIREGDRLHREAEEAIQAESASDTAASVGARGSAGAEGQPSAEQEAKSRWWETPASVFDTFDIDHIIPSERPSLKRALSDERVEELLYGTDAKEPRLPSPEEIDQLFPDKPAERFEGDTASPEALKWWEGFADWERELLFGSRGASQADIQFAYQQDSWVREVLYKDLVEKQQRIVDEFLPDGTSVDSARRSGEAEAEVPQEDSELDALEHGRSHLVHYEREVNILPVHVGSEPCSCDINKDHWVQLGEN